jgi:excisionase family DNA binding protein
MEVDMPLIRFTDMHAYEQALTSNEHYARFSLSPQLAAEALGVSRRHVHQLVRCGALDAVIVGNAHVYFDDEQVALYRDKVLAASRESRKQVRREWIRGRAAPVSTDSRVGSL